ncbi:MAG: 30S ribosomal protein S17 [Candidatus Hydrothermarchaeaceae archaeon]|jgi:small subunit ribosomal protein S17
MCEDKNCPIHGSLKIRGQIIKGRVVSDRMRKTAVVQRDYRRYLKKFERYEKRKSRILAHNPGCINAVIGDEVTIMECRPLSKSKTFVIIEKVK